MRIKMRIPETGLDILDMDREAAGSPIEKLVFTISYREGAERFFYLEGWPQDAFPRLPEQPDAIEEPLPAPGYKPGDMRLPEQPGRFRSAKPRTESVEPVDWPHLEESPVSATSYEPLA
jgi:hypothetical protein